MSEGPQDHGSRKRSARLLVLALWLAGLFFIYMVNVVWRAKPAPSPTVTPPASAPPSASVAPSGSAAASSAPKVLPYVELDVGTLEELNEALLKNIENVHGLDGAQGQALRKVFSQSRAIGQGNPEVSKHPMTRAECRKIRETARTVPADPRCGAPHMVPLYDPSAGETAATASVCIDQFEFPNIPCEYPVVYARANEAAQICKAVGKRLCDAHEWEGGCAGALKPPDQEYAWGERRMMQEYLHNKSREVVWAYGKTKDHTKCATSSVKSPKCFAGGWEQCGTNSYPAGAFPECVSSLGVYDQHGNAAEHMNLPLKPEELGSRGGSGETEMKGSWFVFAKGEAHEDDCRWRALMWHYSRLDDANSHRNYHLGFRCCKDLAAPSAKSP